MNVFIMVMVLIMMMVLILVMVLMMVMVLIMVMVTDINDDQPGGIRGAGPQGQAVPNPRS